MAILIKQDGVLEEITPKDNKKFTLEEAQSLVGGYVQVVRLDRKNILLVNEDGKNLSLEYNEAATILLRKKYRCQDYIVGNVVLCRNNEF